MTAEKLTCPNCGDNVYAADPVCLSCGRELPAEMRAARPPQPGASGTGPSNRPPRPPGPGYATSPSHSAVAPGRVPLGGGFFGKLSRGWAFLKQSLVMWRENPRLIVPSVISLLSLLAYYGLVYLVLWKTGLWDRIMSDEHEGDFVETAVGIPIVLLAYMISYFFVGMTIHLVDAHLRGKKAGLASAYADSFQNLPAMMVLAVLSTIVSTIASRVREKSGFLGRAAANVGEAAWHAATYLVLPVIICEDMSLKDAMKRAVALHKSHFSDLLIAEFGVRIVNRVIGAVAIILTLGQGVLLVSLGGMPLLVLAIIIGAALLSFAMVFTTYVRTAYYTCLYLWAVALEESPVLVPAPAPLAYAFS